jgi:hypothetical protein
MSISRGLCSENISVISYKASTPGQNSVGSKPTPGQKSVGSIPTRPTFPQSCATSEFAGDKKGRPMKKVGGAQEKGVRGTGEGCSHWAGRASDFFCMRRHPMGVAA